MGGSRHRAPRLPILFLLLLLLTAACGESPTGRTQVALVPEGVMEQIGTANFDALLRGQRVIKDPRVVGPVQCVAQALVAALPAGQGSWTVAVFDDPTPNAFALPGGKIGINRGMLRVARTPDQLAAVIGHEIGHVLAHHSNERLTQQLAVQGGLVLMDLLAEDPGSLKHEALRQALGIGAQVGLLLPFSRTHEREADRLGRDLMARAGFDPRASLELWRNLAAAEGGQPLEFLSTHPSHTTRLAELETDLGPAVAAWQQAQREGRRPQCPPAPSAVGNRR